MISRLQALRGAEDGGPMVDAALIFTVLLMLILGIIAFGSVYWAWNTMLLAVEEAGRYAMLYNPNTGYPTPPPQTCSLATPTLGDCAVAWANQTSGPVFGTLSCTSGCTPTTTTTTITFTAQYNFNFIYPITLYRVMTYQLI